MMEKLGPFAEICCFFGLLLIAILAVCLFMIVYSAILKWYDLKKRRWKDNHRFDKPPTGQCYCVACGKWYVANTNKTSGLCYEWDIYTGDCEFCSRGYKRTDSEYEREQWRLKGMKEESEP